VKTSKVDPDDFCSPEVGQVVLTHKGYYAFLPTPLLPNLDWSLSLVSALSKAEQEMSRRMVRLQRAVQVGTKKIGE